MIFLINVVGRVPNFSKFDVGGFCKNLHISITKQDRKLFLVPKFSVESISNLYFIHS